MTVFADYAAFYDDLYESKNYEQEAGWVVGKARSLQPHSKTWLDVGCGTGIHAGAIARHGFTVTGVDRSPEMVTLAQQRSSTEGVSFGVGDLTTLNLGKKFDVVSSLFHVVSYQTETQALEQSVKNLLDHAVPGGVVIFDYWNGAGVLQDLPSVRVKRVSGKTCEITRIAEPEHFPDDSTVAVNYTLYATDRATGALVQARETHLMRYLFTNELSSILKRFGVQTMSFSGWLDNKNPGAAWEACVVALAPA
jgi:SAM-dependent methyltransferase